MEVMNSWKSTCQIRPPSKGSISSSGYSRSTQASKGTNNGRLENVELSDIVANLGVADEIICELVRRADFTQLFKGDFGLQSRLTPLTTHAFESTRPIRRLTWQIFIVASKRP